MRTFSKRLLTWVLAAAMVFGLSGMTAFAAEADDASGSAEDAVAAIAADEEYPESDHPYANSEDASWDYALEGAENGVYVTFDEQTETENGYDYIYIYTGDGIQIGSYTGTTLAGATVYVPTESFTIQLVSDSSVNAWGFAVTNVEAVEGQVDLAEFFTIDDPIAPIHAGETTVALSLGDYTLEQGVDYTVEADTGTAGETVEVTITGIGKYTGTLTTHAFVYDDEHMAEPASFYENYMANLRQSSDEGTSTLRFDSMDDAYASSITDITFEPVESDGSPTDTGELSYPKAPKNITITAANGDFYRSGNYVYFYRTEENPIVYVMAGHGEPYDNPSSSRPLRSYPQTQIYNVTVKATGYEDSVGTVTYYTGTNKTFSIIEDTDGDRTTTDDQTVLNTYTEEDIRELATFANGSSQCGMTGFRTFTTNGVSLEDLLKDEEGEAIEVSASDSFLLQTSDDYGNTFEYSDLFGATRYFLSGIYDPDFKEVYDQAYSDSSSGGNITIRRWLADYALDHGTTIKPRVCVDYNESLIYKEDIDAGVTLPEKDTTIFNSLVSFENQYRFVYGLQIAKEACTVSFDTGAGSDVESQTVLSHYMTSTENTTMRSSYWANSLIIYRDKGDGKEKPDEAQGADTITQPDNPTRMGFDFTGWYADEDCTTAFDFTANDGTVDENTTIYAGWEEQDLDYPNSEHPYANNENDTQTYTYEGTAENGIYVYFDDRTNVEEGYDFIYVYDGDGNLLGEYTGTELAGEALYIPTATFTVCLTSDSSATEWGYRVVGVEAVGETIDLELVGSVEDPLYPTEVNGTPTADVMLNGSELMMLEPGVDYTIFADTSTAGEMVEVTISGNGKYSGTLTTHVFVSDENHRVITATDFDIASGEHNDEDGELNQTIIATITFSEDIALAHRDLRDDLLITIAGGNVYDTARTISYEVQNGNQLVITMVSTGSVAITSGWLSISDITRTGIVAADGQGYVYLEEQGGQIPTGIVVDNDIIEGTDAEPASTYVNVAHKANMRGMYFYQLLSIDAEGNETVLVSTNGHAHDFYNTTTEAVIAENIASSCSNLAGYTVDYEEGDTFFIITADNAVPGERLAVRMVEIKAEINEAHAPGVTELEGDEWVTRCSFCGEILDEELIYADIPIYKDGEEVATITGEEFEAAQDAADLQTFTYTSSSGTKEVEAQFVLISDLLGENQPDEGCGFIATGGDSFTSTFTEDYLDTAYLYSYYDDDETSETYGQYVYRTAVDGSRGNMWAKDVVGFTLGHVFEDGLCTICGALPIYKDGEVVATISRDEFNAAAEAAPEQEFTYTSSGETKEVTAHFVLIKDLFGDAAPDDGCGFIATASDSFTTTFTEEYLDTAYLYYDEENGYYRTAVNGSRGAYWAKDVVSFTLGHVFEDGLCTICGALPIYKDGEVVATISRDEFNAAAEAAPEQEFTYTSSGETKVVTAHFVPIKDLFGDAAPDEGCGFIATGGDDFTSTFTEEYLDTAYLYSYYDDDETSETYGQYVYRTAVNGSAGRYWVKDVVSFTLGHVYEDGVCIICDAEEPITYPDIPVYKDGEVVTTITGDAFAAAQEAAPEQKFTYTSGSGTNEVTAHFVLITDLFGDAAPDEGCGFIATASDDFTSTFTADYLDTAYLYYDTENGYYRTAVNGSRGAYWAKDVVDFTLGHVYEDGVCIICDAEEPITYPDIPVYKDGEVVTTITGDAFAAAQEAAPEQKFTYTSSSGTNEVTAHFVLITDLFGDAAPDEGCGFIATGGDGFTSTFTEEYLDTAYLYYDEENAYYRTAVDGSRGAYWAKDVVDFTLGHVYEDGVCIICDAEEPIITYPDIPVYKDGEVVTTITGDAFAAAQEAAPEQEFTYTSGGETKEVTAHFVLITDLFGDAAPDEGCGFIATGGDGFTSTFTADYLDTAYLYYDTENGYYRTAVDGSRGAYWAKDVVDFTLGHVYEDGVCIICGAEEPIVDKTELNDTIAAADVLDENDYTPDSWEALQTVLEAAKAVAADPNATQDDVDDATAALEAAIADLVPVADKDALNFAIALAEALNEDYYTPESWAAMQDALAAAQAVAADPNATQEAVDEATDNLGMAIAALVTPGDTDKTELTVAIAAAGLLDESDYTPESWAAMQEALAAAQEVADNPDATQEEIDEATSALEDAMYNLVPITPDKADLEKEIEEAKALDKDAYTPDSWAALEDAIANAEAVMNDPDATPEEIEAAMEALKTAMDNLEPVEVKDGLIKDSDGVWRLYKDNVFQRDYTGFAENTNGKWYVERGIVTFTVTDILKDTTGAIGTAGTWYYVIDSKVQEGFTGLSNFSNQYGWWYIVNGKVDFTRNSVDKNVNGWWYVTGGKVQFGYTGVANYKNDNGWWYIRSGAVDFNHNGIDKNKNGWWYVLGGKVQFNFTGLSNCRNEYGWWYIESGKVNFNHTGVDKNVNGWWYVKDSKVQFSYTGIASNQYGTWYISGGAVQFNFSGTVTINGRTYTVRGGRVS